MRREPNRQPASSVHGFCGPNCRSIWRNPVETWNLGLYFLERHVDLRVRHVGAGASTASVSQYEAAVLLTVDADLFRLADQRQLASGRRTAEHVGLTRSEQGSGILPGCKDVEYLGAAQALVDGRSLRKAATRLDFDRTTAFRWRHLLLKASKVSKPKLLDGTDEAGETYILHSQKGAHRLINAGAQAGWQGFHLDP